PDDVHRKRRKSLGRSPSFGSRRSIRPWTARNASTAAITRSSAVNDRSATVLADSARRPPAASSPAGGGASTCAGGGAPGAGVAERDDRWGQPDDGGGEGRRCFGEPRHGRSRCGRGAARDGCATGRCRGRRFGGRGRRRVVVASAGRAAIESLVELADEVG